MLAALSAAPSGAFALCCPVCRVPWSSPYGESVTCERDQVTFNREGGIWRFLTPERLQQHEPFIREYEHVRREEGWGIPDPAYFRALPFRDISGRFSATWRIRAQSYRALCRHVLGAPPQHVVDLGAGNGWLAHRLSAVGHVVAAVDLTASDLDGLGAHRHYDATFVSIQADFDAVPLAGRQADVVVFNGSLHYTRSYERSLREAMRLLRPGGHIVIMDSPLYRDRQSGQLMVREREEDFAERFGVRGDAVPHENYLTHDRLDELADALSLDWQLVRPWRGVRWRARPWLARLRGHREPASFPLVVGRPAVG